MSAVLQMSVQLQSTTCPECGVEHAMPTHLLNSKRNGRGTVYCPNGHVASWEESEADQLRKELARKAADLERMRALVADEKMRATAAEQRLLMANRSLARTKNGVCPCCKRSFTALRRHMATKHPEFKP